MNPNRELPTEEVITLLKSILLPQDAHAETVGDWVWLYTPTKPEKSSREQLVQVGFFWNHKRVVWQHCCGHKSRASKVDPHENYASEKVNL